MSAMSMMTIGDIPNTRISPTIIHINGHILRKYRWKHVFLFFFSLFLIKLYLVYGGKSISSEEQYDPSVYLLNLRKYNSTVQRLFES